MGTACVCAPLIPRASSDSRPSAPCPSPGAGLDAPHQYPQCQCDLSRLPEKYVPDRERSPPPPPHRRSRSRPGRLLHEPRGLLAKGCAYCTTPPHPANYTQPSSSNPRPSCIAPRRCREPLGRPHPRTNKPSAAELLPRARVSYQVPERRSCRLTPDMVIRGWRPDARWRLHWPEAGRPSSGQISSSAAFWCDSGGEVSSSWWPTTSTTD